MLWSITETKSWGYWWLGWPSVRRVVSRAPGPVFLVGGAPWCHPFLLGCQECQGIRCKVPRGPSDCLSAHLPDFPTTLMWPLLSPAPLAAQVLMLWALPWNVLCSALAHFHLPPLINKVPVKLSTPGHLKSVCKIIFPFSLYGPTWYLTNWTSSSFSKRLTLSYFLLWLTLFPVPGVSNFCLQECIHLFRPDFTSPSP